MAFVSRVRCCALLPSFLWMCGCSLPAKGSRPAPLATSLQEIAPHGDRDHFVYVWQRLEEGRTVASGIQVEHVTALGKGEFEVTLSENGMATGSMRFRDQEDTLALLREDDLPRGLRLTYEPPLPQLQAPLFPGNQQFSASATMTTTRDGMTVGVMPVTQAMVVKPGPAVHSRLGDYDRSVVIQMVRALQLPHDTNQLKTETVLVPGLGEISSTGSTTEALLLHRELVCAIISGRRVGDCTELNKILKEEEGAGPSDVQ